MDRRSPAQIVAANVAAAEDAAGVRLVDVGVAPTFGELTFGDLLDIGGVLRVSPASLLAGVPSA